MEEIKKIVFQKTRDFGTKFNASFDFIRQEFKPLMNALLYISGPFIVLGSIMGAYYQKNSLSLMDFSDLSDEVFSDDFIISAIVMIIFSFLAYIFVFATLNEYVKRYIDTGQSVQSQDVWSHVKRNVTTYIGAAIGLFVFTMAFSIGAGVILAGVFAINVFFVNMILFLGLILGVFFLIQFNYVAYIVATTEDTGMFGTLERTYKLFKGHWFSTLGLLLVATLMSSVLNMVFSVPNMVLTSIDAFHTVEEGVPEHNLTQELVRGIAAFVASAGGYFISVLVMLIMIFQYYHMVESSDASGLMGRIDAIGNRQEEEDEEDY